MSLTFGTENRMIPNQAPSVAHGRNYKMLHRRRARTEKDMKLLNVMQQTPQYAKKLYANIAFRENMLKQQESSNMLNEKERLQGMLSLHRNPRLNDGRALQTRIDYLTKRMGEMKPLPLASPEGLYL